MPRISDRLSWKHNASGLYTYQVWLYNIMGMGDVQVPEMLWNPFLPSKANFLIGRFEREKF